MLPWTLRLPQGPRLTLNRELIQQTAFFALVFRVLEGLAAWLLFTEGFFEKIPSAWLLHPAFVAYFLANLVFALSYRAGRITVGLVLADQLINLGTMTVAVACTGGLASPVVLISIFKVGAYAFVFGPGFGATAAAMAVLGFATLVIGADADLWTVVRVEDVLPREAQDSIEFAFRLSVLGMILVGASWVFNQVAAKERRVVEEAARAKEAADREHAAAAVTGALLAVSEAVSRLTRLEEILNAVAEVAPRILNIDYCVILLWNDDSATYRGAAVSGVEPMLARQLKRTGLRATDVPDLEWVRRLGHCAVLGPRGLAGIGVPEVPILLSAPLLSGGRFYGVAVFARRGGQSSFTQGDLTIADGIARQTAVALERGRLVEESRRLGRALESTAEAVLTTDHRGRVVFANQAFLSMFGYGQDEVLGHDCLSLVAEPSDDAIAAIVRQVMEKNWRGEVVLRRKDGSRCPVALNASLIRAEGNRIQGSVAIMEDISAQKAVREQLQRADRLAAAGELAAGVAHEVNNALSGILGQTEAARDTHETETLRAALARVETQGNRIAAVVQGLLGFARPHPPERMPVQLATVVRDTLTLVTHDLTRTGVRSETHLPTDVPLVLADAKQIQQVLVNLFSNAIQAMEPRRGGVLTVSLAADSDWVSLHVRDNGVGIPPEVLKRVFDPFFSTKTKGTGLGLSVSDGIVRAHGGELTVGSTVGEGTTFTLRLPALVVAGTEVPRTALLVDDDAGVAESLTYMLKREGLVVERAATGRDALTILADRTFDAIFLDVCLPDIAGPEVYARLAAERPAAAGRVVFVTGGLWRHDSQGLRHALPAQPILSKPCTAAQIREVLRLLRDARAAA